jgi:hypothetical protein
MITTPIPISISTTTTGTTIAATFVDPSPV